MVKPYLFEYEIDNEKLVVEAENNGHFYIFKNGSLIDFFSLTEADQKDIVEKIDNHFFMRDAIEGWAE